MSQLDSIIDFLMGLDRTEVIFWACILTAPIGGFWYQYEETDDSWPVVLGWTALWTILFPVGVCLLFWQLHRYASIGSRRD